MFILEFLSKFILYERAWILVNPGESHPEQRGHGSPRESLGERCEDRKGFPRWGKSLSFEGTCLYPYPLILALKYLPKQFKISI